MEKIYIGNTGDTSLGVLWVAMSAEGLVAVKFRMSQKEFEAYIHRRFGKPAEYTSDRIKEVVAQLKEYLAGKRHNFTLPICWSMMSDFQRKALQATAKIPYGETRTYGQIAAQIGRPRAARAVGRAEATNPMPLVIPCHRVVGADGGLHGYGGAGGLKTKEWLLKMEGADIE